MKFFLPPLPDLPGEGKVHQYIPPGRSIIGVLTDEHGELTKLATERHIHTCEAGMFPALEDAVRTADLVRLGNRVEVAQEAAPSRPHPRALMRPPWNKLTDAAIGAMDKIRDVASGRKTYPGSSTASAAAKAVADKAI